MESRNRRDLADLLKFEDLRHYLKRHSKISGAIRKSGTLHSLFNPQLVPPFYETLFSISLHCVLIERRTQQPCRSPVKQTE